LYNANRELISETYPDGREHSYDYDLAGNRSMLSDPTGITSFSYACPQPAARDDQS
jgi:YD repeat-containing protein